MGMNLFKGIFVNKKETIVQVLLIIGILITSNLLADELIWRLDLTADNIYTLSDASTDIAGNIDQPITVRAYFSEDLPPQLSQTREQFQNFLEEFRVYSDNNLEYEFINPNKDDQSEQKAQRAGIRPVTIDVRERDQISQKRAYLGAVFHYGEDKEVIPVIQPGASLEYSIASTIKRLTIKNKPKIGVLQGHGEPSLGEMGQLRNQLSQMYEVTEVTGLDTAAVPPELELLMVVAPSEKLSASELAAIDQYIMSGGRAIFAINRVQTNVQRGTANVLDTGIEKLLAAYRLPVNGNLVRDAQSSRIQVRQQQGGFSFVNQVQYPYIPMISSFSDHPISDGLETAVFQFVSSLDVSLSDTTQEVTVLAQSSDRAGIERGRFNLNPMREWTSGDFPQAHIPVAALIEGAFNSAFADTDTVNAPLERVGSNALVVVGDGDFVISGQGQGQQQQQLPGDNINLMVNAVDYLTDSRGLIALRTKGVTNRPIQNLEDSTKNLLRYGNLLVPIFLVVGYGVYRYQRRKSQRQKWIEEGI